MTPSDAANAGNALGGRQSVHAPRRACLGVVALALCNAVFASTFAPREHVAGFLAYSAASTVAALAIGRWAGGVSPASWPQFVLLAAILLRVGALAAPISLSDDLYRYAWDGHLTLAGIHPFAFRPAELARADVPQPLLEAMNSPDYYTVYPPLSQAVFFLAAGLSHFTGLETTFALRAGSVMADCGTVALLIPLVARFGAARGWVLAYALHPVVVWEVAAGGHTEVWTTPLLVVSIDAALRGNALRSGVGLALAGAAKLTVWVLAPVLLVYALRRFGVAGALRLLAAALGTSLFAWAPLASPFLLPHLFESLALYANVFSFNAPVFYALRAAYGYVEGITDPVDALVGPWLLLGQLSVLSCAALRQNGSPRRLLAGMAWALVGYYALSRVLHPWYLLPAVALAAPLRSGALVLFGGMVALSYLRYQPLWHEAWALLGTQWVLWMQWAVPAALLSMRFAQRLTARRPPPT